MPSPLDADEIRARVAAYYGSFTAEGVDERAALFDDACRIEDPAGIVMATDNKSLRRFFREVIQNARLPLTQNLFRDGFAPVPHVAREENPRVVREHLRDVVHGAQLGTFI